MQLNSAVVSNQGRVNNDFNDSNIDVVVHKLYFILKSSKMSLRNTLKGVHSTVKFGWSICTRFTWFFSTELESLGVSTAHNL